MRTGRKEPRAILVTLQTANLETNEAIRPWESVRNKKTLAMTSKNGSLDLMNAPVDIDLIKGCQRAEDMRRLRAGEVTPEELQRENSFIWSAADILYVDLTPKGTEESWARIIQNLQQNSESI